MLHNFASGGEKVWLGSISDQMEDIWLCFQNFLVITTKFVYYNQKIWYKLVTKIAW